MYFLMRNFYFFHENKFCSFYDFKQFIFPQWTLLPCSMYFIENLLNLFIFDYININALSEEFESFLYKNQMFLYNLDIFLLISFCFVLCIY